jgi:hypothetical protein
MTSPASSHLLNDIPDVEQVSRAGMFYNWVVADRNRLPSFVGVCGRGWLFGEDLVEDFEE